MDVDNQSNDSEKILIGGVGRVTKERAKSLRNLICQPEWIIYIENGVIPTGIYEFKWGILKALIIASGCQHLWATRMEFQLLFILAFHMLSFMGKGQFK